VKPGGQGQQPNMQALLKQAQKMQQQMMEAQQELAETEIQGTAGGGLVVATVNGVGDLLELKIDSKAVDPEDTETLADLVIAAVRDATGNAKAVQADKMGPLAGGAGALGLPGF
jgi:DNA-binding YbaB/EbfC family protein